MGGESHKIHWQQWVQTAAGERQSKRNLRNSHVSIRLSDSAQASDVLSLMRQTLKQDVDKNDALVLVASLYNQDKVRFEADISSSNQLQRNNMTTKHTILTLRPQDRVLQIRDRMQAHFLTTKCQLAWWYIAGGEDAAFPNCIDLDGYLSPLEDDESDWGSDDSPLDEQERGRDNPSSILGVGLLERRFPWLLPSTDENQVGYDVNDVILKDPRYLRSSIASRERNRASLLQRRVEEDSLTSFSGYLLKRCPNELHAWRQVYCTLTSDSFWYVTRIYPRGHARHRRIQLSNALLLEPTSDHPPLFRIPYSFELVSDKGISHVFRAPSKGLQTAWIQILQASIVESFESSRMEQADLILRDEAVRHNRRSLEYADLGAWGLQVARYREACRFLDGVLPFERHESLKEPLKGMVSQCWSQASDLVTLAASTHGKLENSCRQVERFLTAVSMSDSGGASENRLGPPPIDLFDAIIADLRKTLEA